VFLARVHHNEWCSAQTHLVRPDYRHDSTLKSYFRLLVRGTRGTRMGIYSAMVSVERVGRLNDRLPYHHMAQRQRINPQTPLLRPITRPQNLRRVLIEVLIGRGARRSFICIMVSVECVGRLNERLSHHRMARGQRIDPQAPVPKALRVP
jgi:hypothetical protein